MWEPASLSPCIIGTIYTFEKNLIIIIIVAVVVFIIIIIIIIITITGGKVVPP